MTPPVKRLLIAGVALLALAAGWGGVELGRKMHPSEAKSPPDAQSTGAVAQFVGATLTTPEGKPIKLDDWRGHVLVINFWATWCPPCRAEMPEFSKMQKQYASNGVQFVGIAIDEASNVVEFSKKTPVSYPLLLGPANSPELMAALGNQQQVLPFTMIIGKDGKLKSSHVGQLTREQLEKLLLPLL